MTHRLVLVVVLLATTLAILPAPAAANWEQRDQHVDTSSSSGNFTDLALAQTFTVGISGDLTRVRLDIVSIPIGDDPSPQLQVEIRTTDNGVPTGSQNPETGTVLASATLTSDSNDDWIDVVFDQRPTLVAGTTYAIVAIPSNRWSWAINNQNVYPGGQSFSCLAACSAMPTFDFVFETYMKQPDTTAPAGSIARTIAGTFSAVRDIGLTLTCDDDISGCDQMQFSITSGDNQTPVPFNADHTYTLPDADGTYTISVRFIDRAELWSEWYAAAPVTLDMTPPTGTVSLVNTTGYTTTRTVSLNLSCQETGSGCHQMQFSTNGIDFSDPEPFDTSKAFELGDTDGAYTISARFLDAAGNLSSTYSTASIILDRGAPTGSIALDNTTGYTNTPTIGLTLTCDDATSGCNQMQFTTVPGTSGTPVAFTTTHTHTLPVVEGEYAVAVSFGDAAGNWGATYTSDTIILDTTKPLVQASNLTLNPTSLDGAPVTYQLSLSDNFTSTGDLSVSCVDQSNAAFPVGSMAPIGVTTVSCTVTDLAGNVGSTSFTVTVLGADGAFDALQSQIDSLEIPRIMKMSLLAQARMAERMADADREQLSCLQLRVLDFTVQILGWVRVVNSQDATAIHDQIHLIHDLLGCNSRR